MGTVCRIRATLAPIKLLLLEGPKFVWRDIVDASAPDLTNSTPVSRAALSAPGRSDAARSPAARPAVSAASAAARAASVPAPRAPGVAEGRGEGTDEGEGEGGGEAEAEAEGEADGGAEDAAAGTCRVDKTNLLRLSADRHQIYQNFYIT